MSSDQKQVRSYARDLDEAALDGKMTFQEACNAVAQLKMDDEDKPIVTRKPAGQLQLQDLPMRHMNVESGQGLVHFVDVILAHTSQFDLDDLEEKLAVCDYKNLPEPLCLKKAIEIPFKMQLVIIPPDRVPCAIVKLYNLAPNRLHVTTIKDLVFGEAMQFDYKGQNRNGFMGINYMIGDLGGFQSRLYTFHPKNAPKEKKTNMTQQLLIIGFAYICPGCRRFPSCTSGWRALGESSSEWQCI